MERRNINKATWKFHYRIARIGFHCPFQMRMAFDTVVDKELLIAAENAKYGVSFTKYFY